MTRPTSQARARATAQRRALLLAAVLLVGVGTLVATSIARAQLLDRLVARLLPVTVQASGNTATVEVKLLNQSLADLTLSFDDATGLTPSALGVTAQLLDPDARSLRERLPDLRLNQLASSLPLLVTIEPRRGSGFSFDRTVQVELHTHLLQYTPGTSYRLFKADIGGEFRDITDEVSSGSVRARGTTGGFSQFLILADLRETDVVVARKVEWLRDRIDDLPAAEQPAFDAYLDTVEASVAAEDYAGAIATLDAFRARAADRAGDTLAATWLPGDAADNHAGELISGAATLKFSIGYLRDFGR